MTNESGNSGPQAMTGAEFKEWRLCLGMSQEEAAAALGLSHRTITSYETGEYSIPPIVTLACQWLDSQAPAGEHAAPVAYRRARKRTGT